MHSELTRRNLLGRAGLALGGVVTLGAIQACGEDEDSPQPAPVDTSSLVADFPYEKHLPADFQLQVAAVKEAAYHGYYEAGCCHGAFSALLADLQRAGAPFDALPLGFGKFGAGGVEGYGSICGAVLGSVLVLNMLVENAAERKKLITELFRWYEGFPFPAYAPTQVDAKETGLTLDFGAGAGLPAFVAHAPGSHLCHASVSGWCSVNGDVDAAGADKKARCARLTADVAGKAAELVNAYLAGAAYGARTAPAATGLDGTSAGCLTCHGAGKTPATQDPVVAAGMPCTSCHPGH